MIAVAPSLIVSMEVPIKVVVMSVFFLLIKVHALFFCGDSNDFNLAVNDLRKNVSLNRDRSCCNCLDSDTEEGSKFSSAA